MYNLIIIGLGGFIGAVLRYSVSGWVYKWLGSEFPYGTLAVNAAGSFLLGLFLTLVTTKIILPYEFKNFVAIGILGAFTTFSTFSYETVMQLQSNLLWAAILNILLNVVLALIALWIGIITARLV
jgi:CrcB protein